jgi:hypothetical protein
MECVGGGGGMKKTNYQITRSINRKISFENKSMYPTSTGCIKKSNLGISQEIDIVLRTKDFSCLGI